MVGRDLSLLNTSHASELTISYVALRNRPVGTRVSFAGLSWTMVCIVETHCFCSFVMVADPSSSFFIWLNLSTITPARRAEAAEGKVSRGGRGGEREVSRGGQGTGEEAYRRRGSSRRASP